MQLNNQCDPHDEHHILRLRDSFIHRSHLCLVFELLSSNLYELIKQNQFQGLSTQLVKVFTAQLLDALTVLKEARLIHCDLKPENILLKTWVLRESRYAFLGLTVITGFNHHKSKSSISARHAMNGKRCTHTFNHDSIDRQRFSSAFHIPPRLICGRWDVSQ